ncbi:MAG: tRNA epoxyqueuosine(34) reductase QueG [Gammaproteobacteria bacterium]
MRSQRVTLDYSILLQDIQRWADELGFQQVGVADTDLSAEEKKLEEWLVQGMHGAMDWMQRHGHKRTRPSDLVPGTLRVISVGMDYLPSNAADAELVLNAPHLGYLSRYALGRDYHKVLRSRLLRLAERMSEKIGEHGYRVFVDSAPVMEKPLARNAGLGWIGKHTNLISRQRGSWFFLGEIYTDIPLPINQVRQTDHCGRCVACIDVCPTKAIIAPYKLDARRCISYLTIELRTSIPVELRPLIGNRIYGCDDCQLICPWNRFAQASCEADFKPRHGLDAQTLVKLFAWSEADFLRYTEGSPIRRIGYECWLRNVAVAMGNAPALPEIMESLKKRLDHPSEMVREHVQWAIENQRAD